MVRNPVNLDGQESAVKDSLLQKKLAMPALSTVENRGSPGEQPRLPSVLAATDALMLIVSFRESEEPLVTGSRIGAWRRSKASLNTSGSLPRFRTELYIACPWIVTCGHFPQTQEKKMKLLWTVNVQV